MTISSTTRKAGPFPGNGVTVAFPFDFKVFSTADLLVVQAVTATGVESTLALTTNYTVSLNADQNASPGGTVTALVAPPTGATLTLASQVANTQSMDLTNAGGFYPSVINTAMDKATIQIQQLAEKVGRSMTVSLSSASDPSAVLSDVFTASAVAVAAAASITEQVAVATHAATGKTSPVDADEIPLADSAASFGLKKLTIANLRLAVGGTDYLNTTRIDVTGAANIDLTANAPNTRHVRITGTPTITAVTVAVGQFYFVEFSGVSVLTNNAAIVTNTGANITTAAGDTCQLRATAANTVEVVGYSRAIQTIAAGSVTPAMLSQPLTLGTTQATTSGTAIDFTGIPSWAKTITLSFVGVSTNGSSALILQSGNGSVETSGYLGAASYLTNTGTVVAQNWTTGFSMETNISTATVRHGSIVLTHLGSNVWASSGNYALSNGATSMVSGSSKTFSGVIDRLRITAINGTDAFDAGSVNILVE